MEKIRFACASCRKQLQANATAVGRPCRCPGCRKPVQVPLMLSHEHVIPTAIAVEEEIPMAMPVRRREPLDVRKRRRRMAKTVPMGLKFPGGAGEMQTRVTQRTADDTMKFATGGFLVAVGALLVMLFTGGKIKPKT